MLPGQSIDACPLWGTSRRMRYPQIVPNSPIGTDTKKTSRHSIGPKSPPKTRPMNIPEIPATWLIPSAMPR